MQNQHNFLGELVDGLPAAADDEDTVHVATVGFQSSYIYGYDKYPKPYPYDNYPYDNYPEGVIGNGYRIANDFTDNRDEVRVVGASSHTGAFSCIYNI